eukprot:CAMPEP_0171452550 /NCGR_PEP_ID=MMETSP0945-20130129/611_1 /TAXON_ID=109269 /ORGANISM="Vaucheria litorea, Strain CCMP2940" /LENGTH=436 /DNA_ID=CAMNT_0011977235 /DNA_START=30 /DNA_END=1340 /DNA_ORIENTATION=-
MSSSPTSFAVEVSVNSNSTIKNEAVKDEVIRILQGGAYSNILDGPIDFSSSKLLQEHVISISITGLRDSGIESIAFWQCELPIYVYRLVSGGAEREVIDGEGDNDDVAAFDQWILPSEELEGLWESIILDHPIKSQLLEYSNSAMLFSQKMVSKAIISWNKVLLMHGPPGTGKTSICKALAHKLSIRLSDRYPTSQLIEINAHSLFSKWFSESGKLVGRLFSHISELADDDECLLCILIDEVESLAAARNISGSEPTDAMRVVNAVLTQLDSLKSRDNVLVLATSNISKAIDLAFIDRADVKIYIGLPGKEARYAIFHSCLRELMRKGIIIPHVEMPSFDTVNLDLSDFGIYSQLLVNKAVGQKKGENFDSISIGHDKLTKAIELAEGLSGRALRKLPFLAHAFFIHSSCVDLKTYNDALLKAVQAEIERREQLLN